LRFSSSAEQNMGMAAILPEPPIWRHWTTDQVRDLMDESRPSPRYELIGGELIVTPSPGAPHQIAITEIWRILDTYLTREAAGIAVASPADLELEPGTITQPDVFVVPPTESETTGDHPIWGAIKSLSLAVEIISPSSVRTDRIIKRDFYLDAGVPDYWVVDLDARMIERWIPSRNTPQVLQTSVEWKPDAAKSPLTIDLVELFNEIRRKCRQLPGQ
jgi:Uma2 family endonuclease